MKRSIITCAVLLFLVCFFFLNSGQSGCAAIPPPDGAGLLVINGDPSLHAGAVVTGDGFVKQLDATTGSGTFIVKWYTALEGDTKQGALTIVSPQGFAGAVRKAEHLHQFYRITNGGKDEIDITGKPLKY